jgi:hypothetical protein
VGEDKNNWIVMRKLKIIEKPKRRFDINVPDEFILVKNIALQYATNIKELEYYYDIGLNAFKEAQSKLAAKTFEKHGNWWVGQRIVESIIK